MSNDATTPAAPDTPQDFSAFEAEENRKAIGEAPAPTPPPAPSPVQSPTPEPTPATEPPPVESKAAPVPDDKAYTKPSSRSKRTEKDQEFVNERIRTSVQEATAALQAEIAALKAKVSPADVTPPPPVTDPTDPQPTEADFETYPAFIAATAKWAIRQAKREADAEVATAQRAQADAAEDRDFRAKVSTWVQRRDAFAATTPAFADAADFLDTLRAGTPMGDAILESEVGPQMALHLATHPDEAERIARLPPIAALRALGKLEAKFDSDTTTSASASAGPAAKTVTTAPAPPMTLSSRSAVPADPAAAALANGDFAAWEAEENRKAVAAAR